MCNASRSYRTADGHVIMSEPNWVLEWDHVQQAYVRRAYTETITSPASGKRTQVPVGWVEEATKAGYLMPVSHSYAFWLVFMDPKALPLSPVEA